MVQEADAAEAEYLDKEGMRRDVKELYDQGIISSDRYEAILYQINKEIILTDEEFVTQVHQAMKLSTRGKSRPELEEDYARAGEIISEQGYELSDHDWVGTGRPWPMRLTDLFGSMAGFIAEQTLPTTVPGTPSAVRPTPADPIRDFKAAFVRSLLRDNVITNAQYRELVETHTLFDGSKSFAEIMDVLSTEYRIRDEDIEAAFDDSTTAVFRRQNREMEAAESSETFGAEATALLTDDEKIANRKAYERLDETFPDKYIWNPENGLIYQVGVNGGLVDTQGNLIEQDPLSPEPPEGYEAEDMRWDRAEITPAPWEEYEIGEQDYWTLLDVVQHPDRYHKGGLERFAGGDPFIGGFSSDYSVTVGEEQQLGAEERKFGQRGSRQRRYSFDEIADEIRGGGLQQEVRRPWYDPGDNWALYAGLSVESVAAEQRKLVEMGALEADEVVEGVWGAAEAEVMTRMMTYANGKAERLEDVSFESWTNFWDNEETAASGRRGFVPPSYRKMDPARAQLTVEDALRRATGRDATSEELADLGVQLTDLHRQSFVADVAAERAEFGAVTAAIESGEEVGVAGVPEVDWEARFLTGLQDKHGAEIDRWKRTQDVSQRQQLIGGALSNFMNQLGGGIGGGTGIGGQG